MTDKKEEMAQKMLKAFQERYCINSIAEHGPHDIVLNPDKIQATETDEDMLKTVGRQVQTSLARFSAKDEFIRQKAGQTVTAETFDYAMKLTADEAEYKNIAKQIFKDMGDEEYFRHENQPLTETGLTDVRKAVGMPTYTRDTVGFNGPEMMDRMHDLLGLDENDAQNHIGVWGDYGLENGEFQLKYDIYVHDTTISGKIAEHELAEKSGGELDRTLAQSTIRNLQKFEPEDTADSDLNAGHSAKETAEKFQRLLENAEHALEESENKAGLTKAPVKKNEPKKGLKQDFEME